MQLIWLSYVFFNFPQYLWKIHWNWLANFRTSGNWSLLKCSTFSVAMTKRRTSEDEKSKQKIEFIFHKTVQLSMQIELSIARHMYRQYSLREFESANYFLFRRNIVLYYIELVSINFSRTWIWDLQRNNIIQLDFMKHLAFYNAANWWWNRHWSEPSEDCLSQSHEPISGSFHDKTNDYT